LDVVKQTAYYRRRLGDLSADRDVHRNEHEDQVDRTGIGDSAATPLVYRSAVGDTQSYRHARSRENWTDVQHLGLDGLV
jgi:hypothetical protein